tara:strand:- start:536 stop:721 length:186 start_codon:yes stop_codon:yes gene_type:complete
MTYDEIADYLSKIEGKRVSRQRIQQLEERALKKLSQELSEDPLVRDYIENLPKRVRRRRKR